MSRSPQDVYARYLLSSRGYPLWIPEPSHQLLLSRRDGLRIGDVGVVVPEDGGFEVFFNICLPSDHPFHRATGVPNNFEPVDLRDEDMRIIPRVENPGRIISTSSVTKIRKVEPPPGDTPSGQLGGLGYEFDLSCNGGALLILPEGAERHDLRNHRLFFEEATRNGVDWYRFAEERLGRMISHDSLYLITGFYKARSWSLAAFENVSGSGEFSARFKMAQAGGSDTAGTYTWETTRALDWRAGPVDNYGFANQSVFIRGFKVALRTSFLGKKRIKVTAGAPSTSSKRGRFSDIVKRDTWISNVWKGLPKYSRPGSGSMRDEAVTDPITVRTSSNVRKHVVPQPTLESQEIFHPSDIINQYLFGKDASANVAITHDNDWIALLETGQLKPEDFVQANTSRVEIAVTNNFHVVSREGVVFLQGQSDAAVDNYATTTDAHETFREHQAAVVPNMQYMGSKICFINPGSQVELVSGKQGIVQGDLQTDNLTNLRMDSDHLVDSEFSSPLTLDHTLCEAKSDLVSLASRPTTGSVHLQNVEDSKMAGQPSTLPSHWTQWSHHDGMQDEDLDSLLDLEDPPPVYGVDILGRHKSTDVAEKLRLLPKSLAPAFTQSSGIHWLLLPYDPRTSKHLLRFDIMLPVDRICYQYRGHVRERPPDEDLDESISNEPPTKMKITFEQQPFNWVIDVDNLQGIRCRDVFDAIYASFNRQLTLGELLRVPNRAVCEDAFRLRHLVLGSSPKERALGWKRVDVLLHHTIFHGLTMNPEGDSVLHLGPPLPVPDLPQSPSFSLYSPSSTEDSDESSGESDPLLRSSCSILASPVDSAHISLSEALHIRGMYVVEEGSTRNSAHPSPSSELTTHLPSLYPSPASSAESSVSHISLAVTPPVVQPREQAMRPRPGRPRGPRPRPDPYGRH